MNITQERTYGWIGSLLIGGLILLFLIFTVIRSIIPDQDEGGILVNFGNVDEASGMFEPQGKGNPEATRESSVYVPPTQVTPPTPTVSPTPRTSVSTATRTSQSSKDLVTQDTEETIALAEARRKENERKIAEAQRRKAEEEKLRAEEQRRQNISNQVSGAFGSANSTAENPTGVGGVGSQTGTSQGTGAGAGNQGSRSGNSDQGMNTGAGGYGSFALGGRGLRGGSGLPRPSYTAQESGVIVISITVDPKGNVIATSIGRGTTIDNSSMRNAALEAARKAKFSSIDGLNNQTGSITYRYQLK